MDSSNHSLYNKIKIIEDIEELTWNNGDDDDDDIYEDASEFL